MNLKQITASVREGKTVHWSNEAYQVVGDYYDGYVIKCLDNDSYIGLTWTDEKTLNGSEKDFYIKTERTK